MPTCAFRRSGGKLTGEHVFADWLTRIGLDLNPVTHDTGPVNRIEPELSPQTYTTGPDAGWPSPTASARVAPWTGHTPDADTPTAHIPHAGIRARHRPYQRFPSNITQTGYEVGERSRPHLAALSTRSPKFLPLDTPTGPTRPLGTVKTRSRKNPPDQANHLDQTGLSEEWS
jgi:hypothetical protein